MLESQDSLKAESEIWRHRIEGYGLNMEGLMNRAKIGENMVRFVVICVGHQEVRKFDRIYKIDLRGFWDFMKIEYVFWGDILALMLHRKLNNI